jgi:hypothetical protein
VQVVVGHQGVAQHPKVLRNSGEALTGAYDMIFLLSYFALALEKVRRTRNQQLIPA